MINAIGINIMIFLFFITILIFPLEAHLRFAKNGRTCSMAALVDYMDVQCYNIHYRPINANEYGKLPEGVICTFVCPNYRHSWTRCLKGRWEIRTRDCEGKPSIVGKYKTKISRRRRAWWWASSTTKVVYQEVIKIDKPPIVTCPSIPLKWQAPAGKTKARVSWPNATADDLEDGQKNVVQDPGPGSGSEFSQGIHSIIYSATDSQGNKGVCTFSFEVEVITCYPIDWPLNGIKNCDISGDIYGTTCKFQCNDGYKLNGNAMVTCGQNGLYNGTSPTCDKKKCPAPVIPQNSIEVCTDLQYHYQSVCMPRCLPGYSILWSQFLLSICKADETWSSPLPNCYDSEPPSFTFCPDNFYVHTDWAMPTANVTWPEPEATDNTDGTITLTQSKGQRSGSQFPVGIHEIRYHATDAQGNQSPDCSFFVIVQELYCTDRFQDNFLLYTCPNNKFTYGSRCMLSCFGNYPLVGNSTIVCDKDDNSYPTVGVWEHGSSVEPFCRRNSCPDLDPPQNGALACDTFGVNKFCQMLCNALYDIPRTAQAHDYYVCGDSGTWSMTSVPDCTQARRPGMMLLPGEIYYFTGDCNNADVIEEIKQNFVQLLDSLTHIWTGICPSTGCTTSSIEVTCGTVSSGRKKKDTYNIKHHLGSSDDHKIEKRQTHQITVKFNINMDWISTNLSAADEFNHNDAEIIKFFNDVIQPLITSGNLTVENYTATSAVFGWSEMVCPTGQVPRYTTVTCAGCPIGTFFNSTRNDCQNCTVGTYQDEDFQLSCKPCPDGTMTEGEGAKNFTKCLDICAPGYYSNTGYEPCFPCPIGQYQPNEMSTSCLRCNDSHTTETQAANSSSQCLDYDVLFKETTSRSTLPVISSTVNSFTLSFLIYLPPLLDSSPVIRINNINGDNSSFSFDATLQIVLHGVSVDTGIYINRTVWTPIAITWDSTLGLLSVFKKGNLVYTKTLSSLQSTPINNGSSLVFMSSSGTKAGWKVDGFVFHGTVLSSSDIDTLSKSCSPVNSGTIYTMEAFRLASSSRIELISPSQCSVVDHCDPNPCGQFPCIDRTTGYICECNDGYTGVNCQTPPDYCANNLCANGASCDAGTNNYTCSCLAGYRGMFCDQQIVNGSWSAWGPWSSDCLVACDATVRNRTRTCDNPSPDPEGAPCNGDAYLEEACVCQECPSFSTVKEYGNEYNCSSVDGYVVCIVTCSAGLTFGADFDNVTYSCGQNTSYSWNVKPPKCLTQTSPERVTLAIRGKYTSFQCSSEEGLKQNLTNQIISDNTIQCVKNHTCSVNVTVSGCNSTSDVTDVIASINLYTDLQGGDNLNIAAKIENKTESAGYTALQLTMEEFGVSHTQIKMMAPAALFAINVDGNNLISSTYDVTRQITCQPGSVYFQSVCVECPSGTYQSNLECPYCNQGSYQPMTKQTSCILCPVGYTTLYTGSKSSNDCFESNDTTTVSTTLAVTTQQTDMTTVDTTTYPTSATVQTMTTTESTNNPTSDAVTTISSTGTVASMVTTLLQSTNSHTSTGITATTAGGGIHLPNNQPTSKSISTTYSTTTGSDNTSGTSDTRVALIGMITGSVIAFLALGFISGYLFHYIRKQMRMKSRDARSHSVGRLNMVRPDSSNNCRPGTATSISGIRFESPPPPYSGMPMIEASSVAQTSHMSRNPFSMKSDIFYNNITHPSDNIKVKEFDHS